MGDLTVEFFCRAPEETLGKKFNYFAERDEKKRSAKSLCRAEFCRVHFAERHVKKRSAKSLPSVFGPLPSVKTLGKVPVSSSGSRQALARRAGACVPVGGTGGGGNRCSSC